MDAGGRRNRLGSMTGEDARTNHIEGTGVSFALAAAAAEGALTAGFSPSSDSCSNSVEAGSDPNSTSSSSAARNESAVAVSVAEQQSHFGPRRWGDGLRATWRRWTFHLRSEVGLAYFLNIVGSVGYVVSSLITLFLTVEQIGSARQIDRASLALDCINMLLFSVDGFLFFHVWWRENPAPTFRGKVRSVYFWANLANTASSVAYFAFVIWALRQRFRLAEEEAALQAQQQGKAGSSSWYDAELVHVKSRQRSLYFGADVVYLLYAALLELGWSREHGQQAAQQQKQRDDASDSKLQQQQQQQQQQQLQLQQLPLRHRKKDSARVTPKSPSQGGSHELDDNAASKSDGAIIFAAAVAANSNANATAISATKDVQLHLKDNA
jgi:hypothetical protein